MLTMAKKKTERNHQLLNTVFLKSIDSSLILPLFYVLFCMLHDEFYRTITKKRDDDNDHDHNHNDVDDDDHGKKRSNQQNTSIT